MTQIKAIGFDYGGVLGGDAEAGKRFKAQVCELINVSMEAWESAYFSKNHLINTGKVTSRRDFWSAILTSLDRNQYLDQAIQLDADLSSSYINLNLDMLNLVDRLRLAGYKVGLLSNASAEVAVKIRAQDVERHFDSFIISAEIGVQKPDCLAFTKLATSLGVTIKELAFIDDATKSLVNAAECGFTPILFKSQQQLETDLRELGLTY